MMTHQRVADRVSLQGHADSVRSLCVLPESTTQDALLLASGGCDNELRIWKVIDPKMHRGLPSEESRRTLDWSTYSHSQSSPRETVERSESEGMGTGGGRGHARPAGHVTLCQKLLGHDGWVEALSVCPGLGVLASGSQDGTVRLWDTSAWTCLCVLEHMSSVNSLAFSSVRLVAASDGGQAR